MQDLVSVHRRRFRRMIDDLGIDPASLIVAPPGFAVRDDSTGRRLTPPLRNQTLAEGLVSAVKLASWSLTEAE